MKKSVAIEKFSIRQVPNGCIAVPAKKSHPLLTRLFGDEESVRQVVEQTLAELIQSVIEVAPQNGVAVIEVRTHADHADFDVATIAQWERAIALDLAPALKKFDLDLAAHWLPDGRIVLPSTSQGNSWKRFYPDGSKTMAENLGDVASFISGHFPDRKTTYFNLADFLDKQGVESPGEFGRGLYKWTACGPWTSFTCSEGKDVYYEDKKAWEKESEQKWWGQCTGLQIGSIVEGSDVYVEGRFLEFPFTEKELDDTVKDIDEEADFYWKRDNSIYYRVIDDKGESIIYCQWVDFDDAPTGDFNEDDAEMLALAIAAREALDNPSANPLAEEGMRGIDYEVKIPIPGTRYFVQECETPDYTF